MSATRATTIPGPLIPPSIPAMSKTTDVSYINGNCSEQQKRFGLHIFKHFVSTPDKSYGAEIGQRLKLVEMNVWGSKDDPSAYGETIFEIEVTKDMCNIFGTLHGACSAYIIDPCSMSSLVTLGIVLGIDGAGVSQTMNLIWHQPAHVGKTLRIVSTSMFIHGRIRAARCELWTGDQLCVSAVHATINPWQKSPQSSQRPPRSTSNTNKTKL